MLVDYLKPPITGEPVPPRLLLKAQTAKDRRILDAVVENCDRLAGCGRDPHTGELDHAEIFLSDDPNPGEPQ